MGRRRNNPASTLPPGYFTKGANPTIYFWFENELGERKPACSKCTNLAGAMAVRASVLREVKRLKERRAPVDSSAWGHAMEWVEARAKLNPGNAKFHRKNLAHAQELLSSMTLAEVKRHHVRRFMEGLMAKITNGEMAPRTALHVYGSLRAMFRLAVADDLIEVTPCTLIGGDGEARELPILEDKDPEWRDSPRSVFTREEVLELISNLNLPEHRRVFYALIFLTGMRDGEAVNRRWRDYDTSMRPLGQLRLATAWSRENKKEKPPKNRRTRLIPVHPTLAAILAQWKLSGWAKEYGRAPTPDDFIVPKPWPRGRDGERMGAPPAGWSPGQRLPSSAAWKWLNGQWRKSGKRTPGDLARLGFPPRREHDTRRTLISLAVEDGAREIVLKHVTHGRPKKSAFDLYPTFTWEATCAEMKKLRLVRQHETEQGQQG